MTTATESSVSVHPYSEADRCKCGAVIDLEDGASELSISTLRLQKVRMAGGKFVTKIIGCPLCNYGRP